jgi:hypothetical protein
VNAVCTPAACLPTSSISASFTFSQPLSARPPRLAISLLHTAAAFLIAAESVVAAAATPTQHQPPPPARTFDIARPLKYVHCRRRPYFVPRVPRHRYVLRHHRHRPCRCHNPAADRPPAAAASRISGTCTSHYYYRPGSPPLPRETSRLFLIYPHLRRELRLSSVVDKIN